VIKSRSCSSVCVLFVQSPHAIDTKALAVGFDVHLVMDNYGTHKVTKVRVWLARHPRYHVHFTPTSAWKWP